MSLTTLSLTELGESSLAQPPATITGNSQKIVNIISSQHGGSWSHVVSGALEKGFLSKTELDFFEQAIMARYGYSQEEIKDISTDDYETLWCDTEIIDDIGRLAEKDIRSMPEFPQIRREFIDQHVQCIVSQFEAVLAEAMVLDMNGTGSGVGPRYNPKGAYMDGPEGDKLGTICHHLFLGENGQISDMDGYTTYQNEVYKPLRDKLNQMLEKYLKDKLISK